MGNSPALPEGYSAFVKTRQAPTRSAKMTGVSVLGPYYRIRVHTKSPPATQWYFRLMALDGASVAVWA